VLVGCPQKHIARLQRAQHALARVVTQQSTRFSLLTSTDLLEQLYWLPIDWRISLLLLPIKLYTPVTRQVRRVTGKALIFYIITNLQGSPAHLPVIYLMCHNITFFGSCAFRVFAPQLYNSVPVYIRQAQTLISFRRHLKTYYFQFAYLAP